MPIIETRTTMLREKPLGQLEPPTPMQRQHWIQKTLAGNRLPIIDSWEPMDVSPLQARVNQGRWLVDCPICRGAEMADPDWLFFVCGSCGAGVWPVVFPSNQAAIEGALLQRPHLSFMSWDWGTSVDELLAAGPFHRSWTAPRTWVTGEVVSSANMNVHIRDNLLQTGPALVTVAGDILQGAGANAMARLPLGAALATLRVNAGATALEYVAGGIVDPHVLAVTGPHTGLLPWGDLNKAGSSLAELATRTHASLSDAPATAHHSNANDHPSSHTLASHSARAHGDLSDAPAAAHHAETRLVRKTTNQSIINDATLNDDNDLKLALLANETWFFEVFLSAKGPTAGDIKLAFTVPSGATVRYGAFGLSTTVGDTFGDARTVVAESSGAIIPLGLAGTTKPIMVIMRGTVRNAGTAGDLQLQWAQNVSTGTTTTVTVDSHLIAHLV